MPTITGVTSNCTSLSSNTSTVAPINNAVINHELSQAEKLTELSAEVERALAKGKEMFARRSVKKRNIGDFYSKVIKFIETGEHKGLENFKIRSQHSNNSEIVVFTLSSSEQEAYRLAFITHISNEKHPTGSVVVLDYKGGKPYKNKDYSNDLDLRVHSRINSIIQAVNQQYSNVGRGQSLSFAEFAEKYFPTTRTTTSSELIDKTMQSDESTQKGTAFNLSGAVAVMSTIVTSTIAPFFETTKQIAPKPENNTILIQQPNQENEIPVAVFAPILALIAIGSAVIGYCAWNRKRRTGEYDLIEAKADAETFNKKEESIDESSSPRSYERNGSEDSINRQSSINSSSNRSSPTSELVDVVTETAESNHAVMTNLL